MKRMGSRSFLRRASRAGLVVEVRAIRKAAEQVSASPPFVIKGQDVSWQPALDLNRVILIGQVVALVALLTVRSVVKAWAKRR